MNKKAPDWLPEVDGSHCGVCKRNMLKPRRYPTIDRRKGVIIPEGGRKKTETEKVCPLTTRARAILDEIRMEKRTGEIVPNVNGLIFTRDDRRPITKGMIEYRIEAVLKNTG
jgi:hypothetical protein